MEAVLTEAQLNPVQDRSARGAAPAATGTREAPGIVKKSEQGLLSAAGFLCPGHRPVIGRGPLRRSGGRWVQFPDLGRKIAAPLSKSEYRWRANSTYVPSAAR